MTTLEAVALWGVVGLPATAGAVLVVARPGDRVAVRFALAAATTAVMLSVLVAVARPAVAVPFVAGADFVLAVDGLAALVLPTVMVVTLLVLVAAVGEALTPAARFHGLMLLFAASAALTVTAGTLPTLLFAWELMGAASYALIGFRWQDGARVSAGLTAFVTTRTADLGLYVAAGAALAGGAGLALSDLAASSPGWRHVMAAGVLVAALGKAAQLPFSFWLSRAMVGPSPVSALLHSAAMVAMGGYLLLRTQPLLAATDWAGPAAMWVGGLTALLLGAVALAQRDLKQLLAASTCAQLGFVVLAAGAGAVAGGATHLVAHAAVKALLFLAAGAWLAALGTKQLPGLAGVARRWLLVGSSASIGLLALAGIAPLSLWATKDAVLAPVRDQSPVLYAVGLAAAALSAAYAGKALVVLWRRVPVDEQAAVDAYRDEEERGTGRIPLAGRMPLVVLAVAAACAGLLALPPVGAVVARAVGQPGGYLPVPVRELGASALIALVVLFLVWRWRAPEPGWARGWLDLRHAARMLVARPAMAAGQAAARFDDRVVDRGVERAAAATTALATRAGRVDDRRIDRVVELVAAGLRRLGHLARRPQTGQLHQYYLQAVVVFVVGVVVLVVLG
ncbi:proton-conducting transporter transmembrane domain-containing protein [Salinispora arenicola]|uniref:proton-conducting transporter transmembrane domain-containing protein n=1 Tax=Salinispora arenicola TaxID=168697 RepID=UPI0016B20F09|nr:proton-conducting transporter membrane subunit [Salinispora arenicola]NIL57335.1 NADH-quinone oxidoreductase subunit L [Salinispora arenicola]NIL61978.1 NADH-quinone oxidoreductase subunit L [Salinispora arenicola]